MVNLYARTFMIATRLDAVEPQPAARPKKRGRRFLGWLR